MMSNRIKMDSGILCLMVSVAIAGLLSLTGCDGDDATGSQEPQVSEIKISPENASLEVGEEMDFSVVAVSATGEVIDSEDIDIEWQWWSSDTEVFTVEPGGLATGQNQGEAYCVVEAVVTVNRHFNKEEDVQIKMAGLTLFQSGNSETIQIEPAAFKKEMRFNGRDSALVVVF